MTPNPEHWNYRSLIRDRIQDFRKRRPSFTLGRLAEKLGIEPSYLSRVLNDSRYQFSEDQLYRVLTQLEFSEWETDYALLLRAYETTGLAPRRKALERKILLCQRIRDYAEVEQIRADLDRIREALICWTREE